VRKVLFALSILVVVVAATGGYETFRYRPDGSQWVSDLHRWSSYALILVTLVALAMWLTRRVTLGRGGAFALAIALVAALVGFFTGGAIRWEQLALSDVTAGGGRRGMLDLSGVVFVIVDGRVLQPDTFHRTVIVHTLVVGVVLAVMLGLAWYFVKRHAVKPDAVEPEEAP
jgi:hypothetical protein